MYFTLQEEDLLSIRGTGFGNGLGISGLRKAPLNLIKKKKQPKKTPWGDEPGRDLTVEVAPLNLMTMVLSVRYDIRIFRSQAGTFIS